MSRVSVVVPVFNGARFLAETLAAIGAQTRPADEVIVVDDGSTDGSDGVAQASGVVTEFLRADRNGGVCRARNLGLERATGSLIAFSDQDDLWDPRKLESQVAVLERHEAIDYLFTNFVHRRGNVVETEDKFAQAPPGWWEEASEAEDASPGLLRLRSPALPALLRFQPAFPSTMMLRRRLLDRAGAFDEAVGREQSEDLEFLLRCDAFGTLAALAAPLVTVRKHGGNYSADSTATTLSQVRILRFMLEDARYAAFRTLLSSEVSRRSAIGFEGAFAAGDLATCRSLLPALPRGKGFRLGVKSAIVALPEPLARQLRALLVRPPSGAAAAGGR